VRRKSDLINGRHPKNKKGKARRPSPLKSVFEDSQDEV